MPDRSAGGRTPDPDGGLMDLLVWLSPAFPVGGFTYSHGLEWAIEDGTVTTAAELERWLADILAHGAGRNDAILFAHAHRAAGQGDVDDLAELIELAAALQPSRERRLEAGAQGAAFMKAILDCWPSPSLAELAAALGPVPWTHAAAVAVAASLHGIPLRPSALGYLQAFAANIVSAGVRAVPLGQTEGLRIVRALAPRIRSIVEEAVDLELDDLGGATFRADIASMKHETQYTRLFRS